MRCRFEKNGIAFAVPFFIVSEISVRDGVITAAKAEVQKMPDNISEDKSVSIVFFIFLRIVSPLTGHPAVCETVVCLRRMPLLFLCLYICLSSINAGYFVKFIQISMKSSMEITPSATKSQREAFCHSALPDVVR